MKRTGSFLILLFTLVSTLSYVVAAPIPSDFEVRNEVLRRSPKSFQEGRLIARGTLETNKAKQATSGASSSHKPSAKAQVIGPKQPAPHAGSSHAAAGPSNADPNQRVGKKKVSIGVIAKAQLKLAGHTAAQYHGNQPQPAQVHATHSFINSPEFGEAYPKLANEKFKSAMITAPAHTGGRGGDDRNHITAELHRDGHNPVTIHAPVPHMPSVPDHIMDQVKTKQDAQRVMQG